MKKPTTMRLNELITEPALKKWKKQKGYPKGLTALVEHLLTDYNSEKTIGERNELLQAIKDIRSGILDAQCYTKESIFIKSIDILIERIEK